MIKNPMDELMIMNFIRSIPLASLEEDVAESAHNHTVGSRNGILRCYACMFQDELSRRKSQIVYSSIRTYEFKNMIPGVDPETNYKMSLKFSKLSQR